MRRSFKQRQLGQSRRARACARVRPCAPVCARVRPCAPLCATYSTKHMLSTLNLDVFLCLINKLPFCTLKKMPFVCNALHHLCVSIHGGWAAYIKSRMVLFQDNCQYVSPPILMGGYRSYRRIFTVRLPAQQANVPLKQLTNSLTINGHVVKYVFLGNDGVEYFQHSVHTVYAMFHVA